MIDILNIESIVFSRLKSQNLYDLKQTFPNINFTTSDGKNTDPKFPTVYVHEVASKETGETIDGDNINGVISAIQIEVYDNESMHNAKIVMDKVLKSMKTMGFRANLMPEFQNSSSVFRRVARFTRVIGDGDII